MQSGVIAETVRFPHILVLIKLFFISLVSHFLVVAFTQIESAVTGLSQS